MKVKRKRNALCLEFCLIIFSIEIIFFDLSRVEGKVHLGPRGDDAMMMTMGEMGGREGRVKKKGGQL